MLIQLEKNIKENLKNISFFRKIILLLKEPLKDKYNIIFLSVSLFINLCIWITLSFFFKPKSEPIFLHYNIYFGIDLIGSWHLIYIIPLSGLAIILINYFLGAFIYPTKKILSYLSIGFSIPLQLFLAVGTLLLIFINI